MLGVSSYPREHVESARATVDARVAAYQALVSAVGPEASAALDDFEPALFNSLVFVLDGLFVHRLRGVEGKDGNALNEVRVLCASMTSSGGRLAADTQIKLTPETSVLGLAVGDEIRLAAKDFAALSEAFFAEIEKRFV